MYSTQFLKLNRVQPHKTFVARPINTFEKPFALQVSVDAIDISAHLCVMHEESAKDLGDSGKCNAVFAKLAQLSDLAKKYQGTNFASMISAFQNSPIVKDDSKTMQALKAAAHATGFFVGQDVIDVYRKIKDSFGSGVPMKSFLSESRSTEEHPWQHLDSL